jgi:Holliday junction resolvase
MDGGGRRREPRFLTGEPDEERERRKSRRGWEGHEQRTALALGGRRTIGSGNKRQKGDVHGGDADAGQRIMGEAKSTKHRQMTLRLEWLEKLVKEAFEAGMEPVLPLCFESLSVGASDWALLPMERLKELLELEADVFAGRATGSLPVSGS